jgi:ADP-ribose pyrophosphatase YjhB (NUDIX family)
MTNKLATIDIMPLLDELQTIARNGLHFSRNVFDQERYQRILTLTSQYYGAIIPIPPAEIQHRLTAEIGRITPKIGANAVILDNSRRILVIRRTDDATWSLPGGFVELHEPPATTIIREVFEETGYHIAIQGIADIVTQPATLSVGPHSLVTIVYLCTIIDGQAHANTIESQEVRFIPISDVQHWHPYHEQQAYAAYARFQTMAHLHP